MTTANAKKHDQVLRTLLGAIDGTPKVEPPENVVDYNWDSPCHFTAGAMDELQKIGRKIARGAAESLGKMLGDEFKAEKPTISEYFGRQVAGLMEEADALVVPVCQGEAEVGLVSFAPANAIPWVERILGGSGMDSDLSRKLTPLEQAICQDLASAVTGAINGILPKDATGVSASDRAYREDYICDLDGAEEYCRMVFPLDEQRALCELIVPSRLFDGACGDGAGACEPLDEGESRSRMLGHIALAPVVGNVDAGQARVSMRDVMSLEPGDVLILEQRVRDPLGLVVQGQRVAVGYPARYEGQYAFQVSAPPATSQAQVPTGSEAN
jgi:flagellar motor switch protein FliM